MIATVALSALKYAAAFQPASTAFAHRAMSGLRMASDNDFDDFSSKVSSFIDWCMWYRNSLDQQRLKNHLNYKQTHYVGR